MEEEMESLFEGMVLFTSSSQLPDPNPPPPRTPSPPPPPTQPSSSSEPLDENLFSDLTLVTPNDPTLPLQSPPPDPSPTSTTETIEPPSSSSINRQVSRRKKRPGFRIGYGRGDSSSLPDEPQPSSSSPIQSHPLPLKPDSPLHSPSPPPPPTPEIESISGLSNHEQVKEEKSEVPIVKEEKFEVPIEKEDTGLGGYKEEKLEIPIGEEDDVSGSGIVEVTIEGKLGRIRGLISDKMEEIREMVKSVSLMRKESARKRRKAAESVNLAALKYKELEKELEKACETEDFEKAECVSESLAAVEREKEGFMVELRDADAECDLVDSKMQEVLELQIKAEEEGVSLMERFAKDAADKANLVLKNGEEFSSKEMNEWMSSVEALELQKMEVEIESHLINDARTELNDSVEHIIGDDRKEKEILCKKREVLTEELEKLLALVKAKEAEIAENDSNIHEVEQKIANAVSGFSEVQSSIDTKYNNAQSLLSRINAESEALSAKKKEVSEFVSREGKKAAMLKELASVSMEEAKACQELVALRKSLALPILEYREVKVRLAKTEEKILEEVQSLRQEVSAARASLQELSSTRSSIQQEFASAKQRIFFIDKRSPELEAEKKVAAAARNFKEAGRIAAEAKTLGVEKESLQIKMEADVVQLAKMEEQINDTITKLNETEELILIKEKEAAMAGCERQLLVAAAAKAERSAALELGDLEEANTLEVEAEAADSEATKIQQAYDLKDKEFESSTKHLISMELIANLGGEQLAKMASSLSLSLSTV